MAEFSIIKALWRNTKVILKLLGIVLGVFACIIFPIILLEYISTIASPIVSFSAIVLGGCFITILILTFIDWIDNH